MEALVPAFVTALLAQIGDRSAWLTAILADRYGKPFLVAIAALFAHALGNVLAGAGAALMAPALTPNARQLLTAIALAAAALGAFWRLAPPDRLAGWQLSAFATSLLGIFILALGDTTQFFTFVFATRSTSPWFAVIGATIATGAVALAAALVGEAGWRRLPIRPVRMGFGIVAAATAAVLTADALRLI